MNFFSYSARYGMFYHPTSAQAKDVADAHVKALSRLLVAGESDVTEADIAAVTWGEVTERATPTGEFGYALKRQDRLSYEAAYPQADNNRMENGEGDMIQIKNIKEKDLLEHDMVLSFAIIWLQVSAVLGRFKLHTFEDITTFVQLLFDAHGVKRGGSEGN